MYTNFDDLITEGVPPAIPKLVYVAERLGNPDTYDEANVIINQFAEREDSWQFCPAILTESTSTQLHAAAYGILSKFIGTRWETVDEETKSGIRDFVLEKFHESAIGRIVPSLHGYIDKLLIELVISDFPQGNPELISMIISMQGEPGALQHIINFLYTLMDTLLGPNAEDKIKYKRIQEISNALEEAAVPIFQMIDTITTSSIGDVQLMKPTLNLLKYFIKSIPPQEIVDHEIFQRIIINALPNTDLVSESLIFLYEVYELPNLPPQLTELCPEVFKKLIEILRTQLPEDVDFDEIAAADELKPKALSSCLLTFLTKQAESIEIPDLAEEIQSALLWMIGMTNISQELSLQTKLTCVEFWKQIARRSWKEMSNGALSEIVENLYIPLFSNLREIIVNTMAKPDELFITLENVDDETCVVRQRTFDTPENEVFKAQKDVLIYLGNINYEETIGVIQENITALQQEFSFDRFNSICYSTGAISGVNKKAENVFILQVVQVILELVGSVDEGSEERAIISGGLMYVLSQYPNFLSTNYEIFITLINKLIEFMHSPKDVIRELAVNSFALLSKPTSKMFNVDNPATQQPLIVDILGNLNELCECIANNDWVVLFFSSLAKIINSCTKSQVKIAELNLLMEPINVQLEAISESLNTDDPDQTGTLIFLLQCNAGIAHWISGGYFDVQLEKILYPIIKFYQDFSAALSAVIPSFIDPDNQPVVIAYRKVKSAICMILSEFISRAADKRKHEDVIVPNVMENIVKEYCESSPLARVPEVLTLLSTMFNKMESIGQQVPELFMTLFQTTVEMVKEDYTSFVSFRVPFYKFVCSMVTEHIDVIVNAPEDSFAVFIQTIEWGVSHPTYDVCTIAMKTIDELFKKMKEKCNPEVYNGFVEAYFIQIVRHTIEMITDTVHRFILEDQAAFLRKLLGFNIQQLDPKLITDAIAELFPNRDPNDIFEYIKALIDASSDSPRFNEILREFMISTKQFSPFDKRIDINHITDMRTMLTEDNVAHFQQDNDEDFLVF